MFMMGMRKSSSISRECNAVEAWGYIVILLSDSAIISSEAPILPRPDVSSALRLNLQHPY